MAVFAPKYAHAFASVVASAKLDAATAQQQLNDFAGTLAGSHELRELLMDPSFPHDQKLKVLDAVCAKIGVYREVRNLFAVIMDHHRLGELNQIVAEYALVADEGAGVAEAEVTSARSLNEQDRSELEQQVAKLAGSRVRVTYREDATLLGGAVVRIGSTIYDGSVKAQLEQMKQRLVSA
ncbi:ATP synthase F1 subunit delta [Granulicella sp. WH15]|jgi:F-type H+-transporting ATPase subunit delta|uniref:ATP synthase F1 subunit delta n=1 Tax=Granulicella sp. WH15 TaxID=2602070 RepID=UPI001366ADA2|nr:ATP synthase F1 subunit delta [Granulicella sp. WH15]QHN04555.1 ATP synthase F1 subunit delta [Granulicella sp. WH15]